MKKTLSIIFLLCAAVFSLSAKDIAVSGTIKDAKGEPVVGAVVILKGTTTVNSVAGIDGKYSVTIPETAKNPVLEASCVGFKSQEIKITTGGKLDIILEDAAEFLDEVVVIGYGAMRRSDLTGSVTSVKIDETTASQSQSIDQLLQGHAAGVQVLTSSAAPDAGVNLRIRGMTSLTGSSDPLYVVDGVIINSTDDAVSLSSGGVGEAIDGGNQLLGLNPQDIASIEILKDASATAIYGSEGANGVVLITTKMATKDKPVIKFSAGLDYVTRNKRYENLTFDEYVEYLEANTFNSYAASRLKKIYKGYVSPENRGELQVTPIDWQEFSLENILRQRYFLSISGRPNTLSYNFSAGYTKSPGIVRSTGLETYTFRLNVEKKILKCITLGTKINYAHVMTTGQTGATSGSPSVSKSMMQSILVSRPYRQITEEDNEEDWDTTSEDLKSTPLRWISDSYQWREQNKLTANLYFQWKILPWLSFKFSAGGDYNNQERTNWRGASVTTATTGATASISDTETIRWNIDNLLLVNKSWGAHNLSGTLGVTADSKQTATNAMLGYNVKQYFLYSEAINSAPNSSFSHSESKFSKVSYFARAIYNYHDRYVLTGTFRVDGSSKFQASNKYATFPSFAFAWRMNQEPWFNVNWISALKLRLGWGQVGNSGVSPYQTYTTYSSNKYPTHNPNADTDYSRGLSSNGLANNKLKWETTQQWNAGVDLSFWHGRLTFTADAYYKHTFDLLNTKLLPYTSGYSVIWTNQGEILNKGLEFAIDATPVKIGDFEWNLNGNISINRNQILNIGTDSEGKAIYLTPDTLTPCNYYLGTKIGEGRYFNAPANIFIEGQPIGLFYGLLTDGVNNVGETSPGFTAGAARGEGYMKYRDLNGDGVITDDDKTIIGNPNPDFTFGFGTNLTWRRLTLTVSFNGSVGNDIVNSNLNMLMDTGYTSMYNIKKSVWQNSWTPENPGAKYPQLGKYVPNDDSGKFTDLNVEDGSYLRLADINLSYNIPIKKFFIKNINVGASVGNAFIWTKYSGWDPSVNSFGSDMKRIGVDNGSYPGSRSFRFDVKFTF